MEYKTGKRQEGLAYAGYGLFSKIASAFTKFLGPWLVYTWSQYKNFQLTPNVAYASQDNTVLSRFLMIYTIVPAIFVILQFIPILFYDMTGEKKARITAALAEKRENESKEKADADEVKKEYEELSRRNFGIRRDQLWLKQKKRKALTAALYAVVAGIVVAVALVLITIFAFTTRYTGFSNEKVAQAYVDTIVQTGDGYNAYKNTLVSKNQKFGKFVTNAYMLPYINEDTEKASFVGTGTDEENCKNRRSLRYNV